MSTCERCGLTVPAQALSACPRCLLLGTDEAEPFPDHPPGLVLEAEIGRGGMGRVFRARHEKLERSVAVKFLPAELASDPAFEARFAREARTLARLSHANLVTVYDFGTLPDGASYLVMELVSGGTLRERLPLSPEAALRAARELCGALAYAHARGVVHRDVKPENVLFDDEGRARLADFGIARLVAPGDGGILTVPLLVLGTPAYMAPEARTGAPADPRMDVFACGILLHEMLTGRIPDAAEEASFPAAQTELGAALLRLATRARARDPNERFPSAVELASALERLDGEAAAGERTAKAEAPSLNPEERSWVRAVALTLAGATAVSLYALLVSATPRVLEANDIVPFAVFDARELSDGRLATRARFEVWPTLSAAAAWAIAFFTYGQLRGHWRRAGLEVQAPERPLSGVRPVLHMALFLNALFVVRLVLERTSIRDFASYIPILGGVLELGLVYLVWAAVLEAWRTSRPLSREPLLWAGLAGSLLPPLVSAVRMLGGSPP